MLKVALLVLLVLGSAACKTGYTLNPSTWDNEPETKGQFVGGRGLVTSEGPTGAFINPTSGTAPKGTVTLQTCVAVFEASGGGTFVGNKSLLTYAFTDWFEVGAIALDIQNDGDSPSIGPTFRARFVREGEKRPEVAVGYYSNEGTIGPIPDYKRVGFLAASKGFFERDEGIFRGARLHVGVKQLWFGNGVGSDTVGYFAGEVALPFWMNLIAEVSTDEKGLPYTPFAFGVQVRHPDGIGFTLAGMQPGFSADIGLYIGIGIGFSF